jgi:hypothetical protein
MTLYQDVNSFDPALDQPITLNFHDIAEDQHFDLANVELHAVTDRQGDLYNLFWPWHDRLYARSIQVRFSAPIYTEAGISTDPVDDILAMVVRFYPGYQETIYGTDSGVVVSKRIFAPLESGYDRSLLWLLECQAEGDRLVRIEIDIDWGEPLEQRIVDGLLVAQGNPGKARGIHSQQPAESTRVFGTGEGRPDRVHFPDAQHAQLVYHLLVAGQVDLPLILTLSDVGEQVAWNGFLAQRDISRAFKLSQDSWAKISRQGRLWTPYPPLNRSVQLGKQSAASHLRRFRTGYGPVDRAVTSVPQLVDVWDILDPTQSRHLLDHLRELADRCGGRLPVELPTLPDPTPPPDPGQAVIETNLAYLQALTNHLSRQPDPQLLQEHYPAVQRCIDSLVNIRQEAELPTPDTLSQLQIGLYMGARLAGFHGDDVNEARWVSEAVADSEGLATQSSEETTRLKIGDWSQLNAVINPLTLPADQLLALAGDAVWQGCGVSVRNGEIFVAPQWPQEWGWWALLNLPVMGETLSLLWDGETLHSTRPIHFEGNVVEHERIQAEGSDAESFNLRFLLIDGQQERTFRPIFYAESSWPSHQPVQGIWLA